MERSTRISGRRTVKTRGHVSAIFMPLRSPTVNAEHLACHPARGIASKPEHRVSNVIRGAQAAHEGGLQQSRLALGAVRLPLRL